MSTGKSPTPAQLGTALSLLVDLVAAEAARSFDAAGIRFILLRGPSIASWLYDKGEFRRYGDVDALVAPEDFAGAERLLWELAFRHAPVDLFPERRHARVWKRETDGATVDLHRSLVGADAAAEALWSVLSAETDEMLLAGRRVEILGEPARAMVVALHAAQHGNWWPTCLDDLARALERLPLETWQEAGALASRIGAMAAFREGLMLFPAGEHLALRLALPDERTVEAALRARTAPHTSLGFLRLSEARGLRAKTAFALRTLAPPAAYMRATSVLARRGLAGLAAAYAVRPVWLMWNALPGFRAWRHARRIAAK